MRIDFSYDPLCPWCWITSRWIVEVSRSRDIDLHWRAFSLRIKNGDGMSEEYKSAADASLKMLRVAVALRETGGEEAVGRFYTALGAQIHHDKVAPADLDLTAVLEELGFDATLATAAEDPAWDAVIQADMDEALALAGDDVGVPIVAFDGKAAYFGPVATPAPTGDEALRIFDAIAVLATSPGFFELKRTRDKGPEFGERPSYAA